MTAAGEIPAPRRPDSHREQQQLLSFIDRAACHPDRLHEARVPADVFDADDPRDPRATVAIAVCVTCTVVDDCRRFALSTTTDGVRAGQVWRNGHVATGRGRR